MQASQHPPLLQQLGWRCWKNSIPILEADQLPTPPENSTKIMQVQVKGRGWNKHSPIQKPTKFLFFSIVQIIKFFNLQKVSKRPSKFRNGLSLNSKTQSVKKMLETHGWKMWISLVGISHLSERRDNLFFGQDFSSSLMGSCKESKERQNSSSWQW